MKKLLTLLLASAAAAAVVSAQPPAPGGPFTLEHMLDYPFPDNLVASTKGAVSVDVQRGALNIGS